MLSENFLVIVENFSAGLAKGHSECLSRTFSSKILFLRKNLFHLNFAIRSRKLLFSVEFFYGGVVKTYFYVSIGTIWEIYFFEIAFFFFNFGQWVKKFLHFVKNIPTELSKLHSKCPWGKTGEFFFIRSIVFFILFGNWAKSLGLLTDVSWRSFENYILRVHKDKLRALFQKKN